MYRCAHCGKISLPGSRAYRVVLETRSKTYPYRSKVNPYRRRLRSGKIDRQPRDDSGGVGREIVREIVVCPKCASPDATA